MKKIISILLVLTIVLVGCGKSESSSTSKTNAKWNPYSNDAKHIYTLNDFLISANNGNHLVKMTVSLEFKNEDGLNKFLGESAPPDPKAKTTTTESSSSTTTHKPAPMEIRINSLISEVMLKIDDKNITNVSFIQNEIKDYLNKNLGLDKDFIKTVYIENYLLQ
jgi:flagellar basal body-associated protein FliL